MFDNKMAQVIHGYLLELNNHNVSVQLDVETNLLQTGLLDSMNVFNLMDFLEKTYGITLDELKISPSQFKSIKSLCELVEENLEKVE